MNRYAIVTDSSCDLPQVTLDALGIRVVPLTVTVNGLVFTNHPDWREIAPSDFYDILSDGGSAATSAPSVGDFVSVIEPLLIEGEDVIYLGFSSGLSGTFNAGRLAVEQLSEKYPERSIRAVDTLCASLGEGLFLTMATEQRDKGLDIDELTEWCGKSAQRVCHWFTVEDLHYLHRGGRVSRTTAVIGSTIGIKPVMRMDESGKLVKVEVARGRKASIKQLASMFVKNAVNKNRAYISHANCLSDAEYLADMLREKAGTEEILINHIGPVIGAHSGPGTLALFFEADNRQR